MKTQFLLLLSLSVLNILTCQDFSSKTYLSKKAQDKFNQLWAKIIENETPLEFYSNFEVSKIFFSDLWVSFNEQGDVLPDGRKKLIHTVGLVAQATFVPNLENNPYTGIFRGSQNAFIRFSVAKQLDTSKTTAAGALGNFAPGIALKFLRDGVASANLVAMFSTSGQSSWNPFKNDFTNSFSLDANPDVLQKALAAKFSSVTNSVATVGLLDLASYDEKGNSIKEPRFPFKLIFRPTAQVNKLFPDDYSDSYTNQLKTIPSGTTVYEVYAIDQPGCNETKIGAIRINSNFKTSRFGDEQMFFRHGLIDLDDQGKDWTRFRDSFSVWSGVTKADKPTPKSGCPFAKLFQ